MPITELFDNNRYMTKENKGTGLFRGRIGNTDNAGRQRIPKQTA
jgi:hypothetical protein